MADFWDPILQRLDASSRYAAQRLGVVSAIDVPNGAVSIDIAGGTVTGLRWLASYSPTVGDFVVIALADGAWVVLGKLSKDLRSGPGTVITTSILRPASVFDGQKWASSPSWAWAPTVSMSGQGKREDRSPSGVLVDTLTASGMVAVFDPIAAQLPVGATVLSATVRMDRYPSYYGGAALVSPVIYGHAYSAQPSGAPSFVSGYGPWRPGTVAAKQSAAWAVPSTWLTALLSGTLRGLAIYSAASADWSEWSSPESFALTVTYSA